jgi:hypothetical protein
VKLIVDEADLLELVNALRVEAVNAQGRDQRAHAHRLEGLADRLLAQAAGGRDDR